MLFPQVNYLSVRLGHLTESLRRLIRLRKNVCLEHVLSDTVILQLPFIHLLDVGRQRALLGPWQVIDLGTDSSLVFCWYLSDHKLLRVPVFCFLYVVYLRAEQMGSLVLIMLLLAQSPVWVLN